MVAGFLFFYAGESEDTARYLSIHLQVSDPSAHRIQRDILFYVFLGVAALGVALFGALGYEETEKERQARLALGRDGSLPDILALELQAKKGRHVRWHSLTSKD